MNTQEKHAKRWAFLRRTPTFLTRLEAPTILKRITPYVKNGQTVADIGCGWGYYTFLLADLVGEKGKVFAVDLGNTCIQAIQDKASKLELHTIEAHATSAADLSFIGDASVDFVFCNGLLCSMENDRKSAVKEINRILNPDGHAYISLGAKPPFGLVDENEWDEYLSEFNVDGGGSFKDQWAIISTKA